MDYYKASDWNITKTCSVCKVEKPLLDFYKQKDGKFGVTSRCKPCLLLANKKHFSLEKAALHTKNWRARGNNRELSLESSRQWRRSNLKYDAFRAATYRAIKNRQTPSWVDLDKIKEVYLNCPDGFHVDHIIPLRGIKASGLHVATNLQYLPAKENMSKRNLYGWD